MLSNGMDFSYVRKFELFRQMKEKFCYVALDFEEEMMTAKSSPSKFDDDYELPDGTIMKVRDERFHSPEALFRPALMVCLFISYSSFFLFIEFNLFRVQTVEVFTKYYTMQS